MKKILLVSLVLVIISFVIGVYFYPQMPDEMASHWNAKGEVDGYMSKFWGSFLLPIVLIAMFLLLVFIPKIDPLRKNILKFGKYFDQFILLMTVFMFYIYGLTIYWNLGFQFDMSLMMMPALGAIFYFIGVILEKSKRNWTIGIRTPWTLSNDKVWKKTNGLGGKLFKICAGVALIGMLFGEYSLWFVLVPVIGCSIFLIIYSYFVFKKAKK